MSDVYIWGYTPFYLYFVVIAQFVIAFTLGFITAIVVGFKRPACVAVANETGLQNAILAVAIISLTYSDEDLRADATGIPILYSAFSTILGIVFSIILFKFGWSNALKGTGIIQAYKEYQKQRKKSFEAKYGPDAAVPMLATGKTSTGQPGDRSAQSNAVNVSQMMMNGRDDTNSDNNMNTGRGDSPTVDNKKKPNVKNVDELNYAKWTEKDVIEWVKMILENGFENDKDGNDDKDDKDDTDDKDVDRNTIDTFLNEFTNKNVNGAIIQEWKQNEQLIDKFIQQFSEKNQSEQIWKIVKNGVDKLGSIL